MKTFIKYFSVSVFVILLLLCSLRIQKRYQYAKAHDLVMSKIRISSNDSLKVFLIGDSWAYLHKDYDSLFCSMIIKKGIPCRVISKGYSGANSKELYQHMFTSDFSFLIDNPSYCVIIVGINDAVEKMGKDFYSYHYILILKQLLKMGIMPVVLEIPEVNYRAIANRKPWTNRIRYILSSLLTGSELYSFTSYKTAIINAIRQEKLQNNIVYIGADSWNPKGYHDSRGLYMLDETHLNAKGYEVMDSCIVSEILKDIWKRKK